MYTFLALLNVALLFCSASALNTNRFKSRHPNDIKSAHDDEDTVMMRGIPVYGYQTAMQDARKTGSFARGTLEENIVVSWVVMFSTNIGIHELCTNVFIACTDVDNRTSYKKLGIPSLITHCSAVQLNETLSTVRDMGFIPKFAEYDFATQAEDISVGLGSEQKTSPSIDTWGLDRIGNNNSISSGKAVHAYVLDTGIRVTHFEFGGRAIAQLETLGAVHECECRNTSCAADRNGHGTAVAAIIGGNTYGVARQTRIHAVKIFHDDNSGYQSYIILAMSWILDHGMRPAIVNLPIARNKIESVRVSVDALTSAGVVVVGGAGQMVPDFHTNPFDACLFLPGFIPSIITVGSTDVSDAYWENSNYGSCVDILAPGKSIWSAWNATDTDVKMTSTTALSSGYVAGAAAILLSLNPNMTVSQVTAELLFKGESGSISNVPAGSPNLLLRIDHLTGNW